MKAPVKYAKKLHQEPKRRTRAYFTFIYKAQKEVSQAGMRSRDFLDGRFGYPKHVWLRLVGLEASRLSKTNRPRVITQQEINAAVTLVKQRTRTRDAA